MSDTDQVQADDSDADDFEIVSAVMKALRPLSDDRRRRIVKTVLTFYGMDASIGSAGRYAAADAAPSGISGGGGYTEDRSASPKEFLMEKRPSTEVERVACLAFYLTHYRDTPHFKTIEISKLNTEAAQIKFSNAARAVDNAAKAGFLVPATKGNKQLSGMAEQYVQALPDRAAAKEAIVGARPKRKRRPRTTASGGEAKQ